MLEQSATPDEQAFEQGQREWLATQFEALTDSLEVVTPSQWAEQKRYLPPSATAMPGFYRFDVAPYLREIVDCLSVDSPIREVSVMKGVQLGMTVGILENAIGYLIEHVKSAPVMWITADAELAKLRLESYVIPMIQASGLSHLIKSSDEGNSRKTGKTDKKLEWFGGGFLVPAGAQNPAKMRSVSIQVMLRDEIDGWPDVVGKDGDPIKLSTDRTAAYEDSRKLLDISTPLVKGASKIASRFAQGDQRYYYVCCLKCGFPQTLRWRREDSSTGVVSGIVWETENGRLVPGSVRYACKECGHLHTNDDKTRLLSPRYGAEWRPTAPPATPYHRSYHVNALYSPVGMQTWETHVHKWLEVWDVERNRPKDNGQLQVFYNNVLGEPYEVRGEKIRFESVSEHRRAEYKFGEIPNHFAKKHCSSAVLLVTCAVDVHKDSLKVGTIGWCRDRRAFLIEYLTLEGDTEQLDDPGTWGELRKLIETKQYVADDGKKYRPQLTLIDSGYNSDKVYEFCAEYEAGVYPIKGRDTPPKGSLVKEFAEFETDMGTIAYFITVDMYKDRWSPALRRGWDRMGIQPIGHFNAPCDVTDKQLKELTTETKREVIDERTNKRVGHIWYRPRGVANELWDILVYNNAALDLIAWNYCVGQLELEGVDWSLFYGMCERDQAYFET